MQKNISLVFFLSGNHQIREKKRKTMSGCYYSDTMIKRDLIEITVGNKNSSKKKKSKREYKAH